MQYHVLLVTNVPPVLPGCEIVRSQRPAHLAETGGTLTPQASYLGGCVPLLSTLAQFTGPLDPAVQQSSSVVHSSVWNIAGGYWTGHS